jgi:putative tryptophan/tyrosine transport system substrate-binding protein
MRRREFITLVGGAAVLPVAARAQQGERMRRIGVLVSGSEGDPEMQARLAGFREGLKRLGWTEGDNLRIDYRYASASAERSQALARELVALRPDAVLAFASISAVALQRESRALPIVFVGIPDPIGLGLIASLAQPGGNLTGSLLYEPAIVGKWLAMLKELAPQLTRVAILFNRKTSPYPYYEPTANAIAPSLAIELVAMHVETAAEIERAIESFARVPNGGLLVPPDLTAVLHRDLVIALAARHRLPAVYQARFSYPCCPHSHARPARPAIG